MLLFLAHRDIVYCIANIHQNVLANLAWQN